MREIPKAPTDGVPYLTTDQMREVDRLMVEEYGIVLLQMRENAGRGLARLARDRFLDGDVRGRSVVIMAGSGGNGGGGLVCARRLAGLGSAVHVLLANEPERLGEVPSHQLAILERMGVPFEVARNDAELPSTDLVVDALIGYSLSGAPRGAAAALIRQANAAEVPVLSLDVPSGVHTATGVVNAPAIEATATLTLALPKEGLRADNARRNVGELYLADIGVPPELYARPTIGLEVGALFAEDDLLRIW
jgi:NAD(P)H-hydrate epimerase